ncbi:DUF1499 domain-containing protein [uncultured Psychrobacter sp.]|uniref:DUF1499 domain-containing protein n=1 Tax=uncultured Psychrobacter sp. TaxID=259303 RepID=UPI00345839EF
MKVLVSLVSFIALLLVLLPGPLYRFGIAELSTAFMLFRFGLYAGVLALVLLLIQVIFKRKTITLTSALTAVIFSAIAIIVPLSMMTTAQKVPPIHDISTDLDNPPEFVAIAPLRADAANPVAYAGAETAEQQRQAFPELQTLNYPQSQSELIAAAEQAANNLSWDIVNVDGNAGIIEATDTTMWFGFKDDVVIRVTDDGSERLLDIRSKSRVGKSDLGKNADRIRSFIEELDGVLGE